MDDLLAEFLTETNESLAELDLALVKLEHAPDDAPTLAQVFRMMHTIKGTCGFLGLPRLERVAHAAENVLDGVREGRLPMTPLVASAVFAAIDRIKLILGGIGDDGAERPGDDAALVGDLDRVAALDTGHEPATEEMATTSASLVRDEQEAVAPVQDVAVQEAVPAETPSDAGAQTIRVDVAVLEELMTMVGELVLARNQLLQLARSQRAGAEAEAFAAPLQRLSQITSDLQEGVMKTRMQPIGHAWNKLPRLVRDLSRELDKPIELVLRGAATELDRQVLELIRDPLTHMVRNSADHGLERPAVRRAAGKREAGTITLDAFHEGGHIVIEIADDGAGLPLGRIRARALARGLATEEELDGMDDERILRFIFQPGFSTAEAVTSLSGRGVGMDVVKSNIARIGGSIEVFSTPGRGTRFRLNIPLTLAIISALIVEAGGERFAMPQISVMELVRARTLGRTGAAGEGETVVERIDGAMMLRLRGRLLPLLSLRDVLRLDAAGGGAAEPAEATTIVVAKVGTAMVGILIDRVFDTEEIVVKPVAAILRGIPVFSGNTILGDGSVIMILDPAGVARAAGIAGGDGETRTAIAKPAVTSEERLPMLLVRAGGDAMAVPLSLVSRLEHVVAERLEVAGSRLVMQYRGRLMPLAAVSGEIDRSRAQQAVLVFTDVEQATGRDRSVGLVVDEIVDVVEDRLTVELAGTRPGLLGTAVVGGHAVQVIDTGYWLVQAFPDWFVATNTAARAAPRLLVVEDSRFFRQMLVPALSASGFAVSAVGDGTEALALRDAGEVFDAIVSDIEMPGMGGLEFVRRVRAEGPWAGLPVVALSGRLAPADVEAGFAAGFTDYIEKFNRDRLVASLRRSLAPAVEVAPTETGAVGHDLVHSLPEQFVATRMAA